MNKNKLIGLGIVFILFSGCESITEHVVDGKLNDTKIKVLENLAKKDKTVKFIIEELKGYEKLKINAKQIVKLQEENKSLKAKITVLEKKKNNITSMFN